LITIAPVVTELESMVLVELMTPSMKIDPDVPMPPATTNAPDEDDVADVMLLMVTTPLDVIPFKTPTEVI
jgi:hypothetical protein